MPNIKFNYLYRDSGNYKKFSSIIFSNRTDIELLELETLIKSKLIYNEWLYAEEWQLPEVFTDIVDFRIDPTWHEFESVEYTEEPANSTIPLSELITIIEKTNWVF
jgi:hypothetical protein